MSVLIRTSMLLGFGLMRRRCVCRERLLKTNNELLSEDPNLIADISFSSIRKVVMCHSESLSIRFANGSFGVCRKGSTGSDKIFDNKFQNKCYSALYSEDTYRRIERILLDTK